MLTVCCRSLVSEEWKLTWIWCQTVSLHAPLLASGAHSSPPNSIRCTNAALTWMPQNLTKNQRLPNSYSVLLVLNWQGHFWVTRAHHDVAPFLGFWNGLKFSMFSNKLGGAGRFPYERGSSIQQEFLVSGVGSVANKIPSHQLTWKCTDHDRPV